MAKKEYDTYTFIAGAALKNGKRFMVRCNCGGQAPITPPLKTEFVICPECGASIKLLVIEGDPGYIVGRQPNGEPMLIPVQGSKAKRLSAEEYKEAIARVKKQMGEQKTKEPPKE